MKKQSKSPASIEERRIGLSLITTIVMSAIYGVYVYNTYQVKGDSAETTTFWAGSILTFIFISVVVQIIMTIALHIMSAITRGTDKDLISDERDDAIELKGERISHNLFLIGFIASIVMLANGASTFTMLFTLLLSGLVSSTIGLMAQLFYYRRGF